MLISWTSLKVDWGDDSTTQSDIDLNKIFVAGDQLIDGMRHRIVDSVQFALCPLRLDYGE